MNEPIEPSGETYSPETSSPEIYTPENYAPTEEQLAERAARADKATRGVLAALLCFEAFCLLLVPRAIAQTSIGLDGMKTAVLIAGAVVLVAAGFMMRRPWGIGLGSALQVAQFATIAWIRAFALIVIVFAGIWLYVLNIRHDLVRTPSGWRLLVS